MKGAPVLAALVLLLEGCGHGGPSAVSLPSPSPTAVSTPASVHPVSGVVFYDENANGVIDDGEDVRLPHVVLTLGGRSTESDAEGAFAASAVPAGTRTVEIRPESLPPQFRAGRVPSVAVPLPEGARVPVPVVLPIGSNQPNTYLAFGDSITAGDGSRGSRGYRSALQSSLRDYWGGRAEVLNDGSAPLWRPVEPPTWKPKPLKGPEGAAADRKGCNTTRPA